LGAAAILSPFAVVSVELLLTRHFNNRAAGWDYAGIGVALIIGLFCLWRIPISKLNRLVLCSIFTPIAIGALVYYAILFVCVVYGDCL
jgi:hypothetical protein